MKQVKKRFSKSEDANIIKHVKSNIGNLSLAFSLSSLELNRSFASVSQRYYRTIRTSTPLFIHVSGRGMSMNVKNEMRDKYTTSTVDKITVTSLKEFFGTLSNTNLKKFKDALN